MRISLQYDSFKWLSYKITSSSGIINKSRHLRISLWCDSLKWISDIITSFKGIIKKIPLHHENDSPKRIVEKEIKELLKNDIASREWQPLATGPFLLNVIQKFERPNQ